MSVCAAVALQTSDQDNEAFLRKFQDRIKRSALPILLVSHTVVLVMSPSISIPVHELVPCGLGSTSIN